MPRNRGRPGKEKRKKKQELPKSTNVGNTKKSKPARNDRGLSSLREGKGR